MATLITQLGVVAANWDFNAATSWAAAGLLALVAAAVALMLMPRWPTLRGSGQRTARASSKQVLDTGKALNAELAKVLGVIRMRVATDESYSASLAAAQTRLGQLPTTEQVRVIVSLLVAENHRMRLDSVAMTNQLTASHKQIENLRTRLEQAQEAGMQDALTSVGNRRCFDVTLAEAMKLAQANSSALSIVLGDLDSFKKINDEFGHQVGDEVLKFFGQLLQTNAREGDTVARFGGEEFAIVLPNCRGHEAVGIAERARIKLGAKTLTIRTTSQEIGTVTASFGVAEMERGDSIEQFLRRADTGLYEAKKRGRNRVVLA